MTGTVQQQFSTDMNSALFASPAHFLARPGRMITSLDTGVIKSFNFVLRLILISANRSAMSHRPWEESAPDPETPNPVTPIKPPRNAGAGQDNPDAEISEC